MEIGVAFPLGMNDRPSFLIDCRVYSFETEIETEQKVCEIHTQTYAVCCGNLFVEFIERELTIRLVLIFSYRPNIAGVNENRAFKYPKQFSTIFEA